MKERELFLAAIEIADPDARRAHLETNCGDDAVLLARVESLLASHEGESRFLNTPVAEQIAESTNVEDAATLAGSGSTQDEELDRTAVFSGSDVRVKGEQDATDEENPLGYLAPSSRPGSLGRLAHYEVLEVIGRGAFGIVLRAFDEKLQRVVAIKVMSLELASTSPARKRFLREAQASAAIRHEHVVSVYAVEEKPIPYLVMEYIPGLTLQQRLDERGPLDVLTVLRLGRQIAEGLDAAHSQGLVHRDIKPGNILLEAGILDKVKITDFGLARAADDASLTQSGMIAGTPMYMAPEQAQGYKLDQRADLFSLGSVLYQMVSGRPPFRAPTALAVLKRVVEEVPRPIREIIPETPQWLCDIIAKLHAKSPDDRYQSVREVANVLADCESQLKEHARLKDMSLIPRVRSRGSWKWAAVAFPMLTLAILGLFFAVRSDIKNDLPKQVSDGQGTEVFAPVTGAKATRSTVGRWVQLFNGHDLVGWKSHPHQPGNWRVEDNVLVGSGPGHPGHLFSERGDYQDFHLRAIVKIEQRGNDPTQWADSGIFFRSPFAVDSGGSWAIGYEAQIHAGSTTFSGGAPIRTGSLNELANYDQPIPGAGAGEWFTLEVIARGSRITIKVNDVTTVDAYEDLSFLRGHLVLQQGSDDTIVSFKKIEIQELATSHPPVAIAPFDAAQARAHQEAWAKHLGLPVEYTNGIGMQFVLIPPGEFMMGGTREEIDVALKEVPMESHRRLRSEAPRHKVILTRPFYLSATEVTQSQYKQVTERAPSNFSPEGQGREAIADLATDQHPVERVSWNDAAEFCAILSRLQQLKPHYARLGEQVTSLAGTGYRLPTEAEWEFACRAGTTTRFWSGDRDADLAHAGWSKKNAAARTHTVGELKSNPFGLYDIHGNVWEWVQDGWDPQFYSRSRDEGAIDPVCPFSSTSDMVYRGGAWHDAPTYHCSSFRGGHSSSMLLTGVGFRVALPVGAVYDALRQPTSDVAQPAPRSPAFTNRQGMEFVLVPKGTSWLGGGKDKQSDKAVEIAADFYMGKYEVTQQEWQQVMGENPSAIAGPGNRNRFPVESVTWNQCQVFLAKLNAMEKEPGWVYRLPTETEWEYACRGGPMADRQQSAFDFYFAQPTNACSPTQANFHLEQSCHVGSYTPNSLGLYDMHGNVHEWCDDARGTERVHRGGCWGFGADQGRAAMTSQFPPTSGSRHLGLRLVRVSAKAPASRSFSSSEATSPLTDADIERIAMLPAILQVEEVRKELKNRNPKFDGSLMPTFENNAVTGLEFPASHVSDISPLRALRRLASLTCRADGLSVGMVSDLKPLQGMQLVKLTLSVNPVSDLSPLAGMPLTELHIDNSHVSDLSPLNGMPLQVLNCSYSNVSSLVALQGMPLKILWCNNTEIAELAPLKGMPLEWLTFQGTKISDISPLAGMPLTQIYLDYQPARDRDILRSLAKLQQINDQPAAEFWRKSEAKRNK